ncbi:signal peptidase I [Desulfallas sp. Bu1-1]|uniref:signal peptidase I n=1 Tax=Desulfallas sp. Bu1-1 TaxID=2787620 RepID=UPI00189F4E4F|nr:signal peptidase I [Desulfallas sp. Bu1-1]MBF7083261.1 signal peptidase I [Desulfallas sp. Bu1-1]
MKLVLKILNFTITAILVLVIVAAVGITVSARFSNDRIPTIYGYKLLNVLSGSMEPVIHTGDAIIVRPLAGNDEIGEGDVITFRTKEKEYMLITHRVMGVVKVNDKPAAYVTKGDANDSEDLSTVARDQIVGIYKWRLPYFGYLNNFLHKPTGIIVCVIIPALLITGSELIKIYKVLEEEERAKKVGGESGEHSKA